jgi:hypothetical protein
MAALAGERTDFVPLTIYADLLPDGELGRRLRTEGLGLVSNCSPARAETPHVEYDSRQWEADGRTWSRHAIRTPAGEVEQVARREPGYGSWWVSEHYVRSPADYRALEFMIRDTRWLPDHDAWRAADEQMGDGGVVMASGQRTPMQKIIIEYAGVERFSMDLADDREELFALHDALVENQRRLWEIIAESPAALCWVPDNITATVIGRPRFERFCAPRYREYAELLAASGKRTVVHMDGALRALAEAVAATPVGIVEAFTPPPDGDLSVAEARAAWPGKALWLNFTSSMHLASPQRIAEHTRELVREGAGGGFAVGITENVPDPAWRTSLPAILRTLREG